MTLVVLDMSEMSWEPEPLGDGSYPRGAYEDTIGVKPGLSLAWQADAECLSANPRLFYPARGEDTTPAKAICARCPVKAQCLDFAIENVEKFGIWGGTSEKERRVIRRDRFRSGEIGGAA